MQRLFPDHTFVTLDLPSEAEQAERDPGSFLARHPPPVIVDEVQYAPGLFRHLKAAVDRDRSRAGAFLLTGSQPLGLMKSVSDSLAGRASIVELEPLSFAEAKAARPHLGVEEFLVRGGFPELHENPAIESEDFLRSYVATYLERDLRQLLQVSSLRDFERFLRAAALRTAQLLNRADLARDVGISGSTAGAWLSALEASHQLVLLEPWFAKPHQGAREAAQALSPRCRSRGVSVRRTYDAGAVLVAARRCAVGDSRTRGDPPLTVRPAGRVELPFLAGPHARGRLPPASGRQLPPRGTPSGPSTRAVATPGCCARSPARCRPVPSARCRSSAGRPIPIRSVPTTCTRFRSRSREGWENGRSFAVKVPSGNASSRVREHLARMGDRGPSARCGRDARPPRSGLLGDILAMRASGLLTIAISVRRRTMNNRGFASSVEA